MKFTDQPLTAEEMHTQCLHCHDVYNGPRKGMQPGKTVRAISNTTGRGYEDDRELEAAEGREMLFPQEAVSHGVCTKRECRQKQADTVAEMIRERQLQREREQREREQQQAPAPGEEAAG